MEFIIGILIFVTVAFIYFLPSFIAVIRGVDTAGVVCMLNIVFGITGIGWLICLVWAMCGRVEVKDRSRAPNMFRDKSTGWDQ